MTSRYTFKGHYPQVMSVLEKYSVSILFLAKTSMHPDTVFMRALYFLHLQIHKHIYVQYLFIYLFVCLLLFYK